VQVGGGFEQFAINGENASAVILGECQIKGVVNKKRGRTLLFNFFRED
jgi:hypothetical protein